MSYALTVGVCFKYLMGYQTLHLNVLNVSLNSIMSYRGNWVYLYIPCEIRLLTDIAPVGHRKV